MVGTSNQSVPFRHGHWRIVLASHSGYELTVTSCLFFFLRQKKPQKPQQLIEAHASGNQVVIDSSILRSSWVAAEILAVLECSGWICSCFFFFKGPTTVGGSSYDWGMFHCPHYINSISDLNILKPSCPCDKSQLLMVSPNMVGLCGIIKRPRKICAHLRLELLEIPGKICNPSLNREVIHLVNTTGWGPRWLLRSVASEKWPKKTWTNDGLW